MGMNMETYTPEQFARSLYLRGYFKSKAAAEKYVKDNPKDEYTENDFENIYHDANLGEEYMRNTPIKGLTADGRNKFDPAYWGYFDE